MPLSQIKATFPVLKNPANRHRAVGFTLEQWHYAFTNTFSEEESPRALRALPRPGVGPRSSGAARWPTSSPGTRTTTTSTTTTTTARRCCSSPAREDHLMPPSIQQSNAKHYKSDGRSPRSRSSRARTCCRRSDGWEEVADYALDWALEHAAASVGTDRRRERRSDVVDGSVRSLTHIGGPTVLHRGRRLAHADRPDVRRARAGRTTFGWGTSSRKLAGPAIAAADLGADRRGAAHPRPPRRQPRRRRARAAAVGAASSSRPTPGARRLGGDARGLEPWADDPARGARAGRRSRSPRRRAATGRR